jgi:hypothetical protein
MNDERRTISLHGLLYSLAVAMENVCCLLVSTETLILSWSLGIHLHGNVCFFRSNDMVSKSLQLSFSNPWTRLFNTRRWFVSNNRISAETWLPTRFLETWHSDNVYGVRKYFLIPHPTHLHLCEYWVTLYRPIVLRFPSLLYVVFLTMCPKRRILSLLRCSSLILSLQLWSEVLWTHQTPLIRQHHEFNTSFLLYKAWSSICLRLWVTSPCRGDNFTLISWSLIVGFKKAWKLLCCGCEK